MKIHRLLQGFGPRRSTSTGPSATAPPSRPWPARRCNTNLPANAARLAATAPLEARTTYNVRVSGYVQAAKGGTWVQFKTRTWSFTTA